MPPPIYDHPILFPLLEAHRATVASSSSVRRPESKDTSSKKRVFLNTKSKSTSKDVKKSQRSVSLVSNKHDTMNSNVSESNANVIQIVLGIVDSGSSKHMTRNLKLLRNFIEKFMGTVRFRNDNFVAIIGYGDYVQGNLTICYVYYVEGLRHNLFLVGQFCNGDLEVAFHSNTYYVWNLEGEDLLTSSRDSNLYTMASEWNNSGPGLTCSKFQDSSEELNEITLKEDLDNFFGPLCEEYYAMRTLEVLDNFAANTLDNEDTHLSSSIIVEDNDAPQKDN
ncbi:hypothetical protein Tco_1228638 [Tanacetum coccineum]